MKKKSILKSVWDLILLEIENRLNGECFRGFNLSFKYVFKFILTYLFFQLFNIKK